MPSIEIMVATGQDDGYITDPNIFSNSASNAIMGRRGAATLDNAFVRFQNCNIPRLATINNASITFISKNSEVGIICRLLIRGDEEGDPLAPTSYADYQSKGKTTNSVSWEPEIWNTNEAYVTPNLSDIVQEKVNQISWNRGNSLQFFFENNISDSNSNREFWTYDGDTTKAAVLNIEYTLVSTSRSNKMASEQQYLAAEVALWLQQKCGDPWEFLGCHNLTGISVPRGDTSPVYCRTGKNKFEIQRTWRGTAGLGSLTVVAYDTILNTLQELGCAVNLVALYSASGSDDDPFNFDYLYYYNGVEVTSEETDTQVVGQNPDDQTVIMLSMPASFRERIKVKSLDASDVDVSGLTSNNINAVTFCDEPSCDNFGNLSTIGCQTIFAVTDGATAVILKSTDGGGTWSAISSPFTDADDPIGDIACDGDTVIVTNSEDTAYAYSWDSGVSWTEVLTPTKLINAVFMLGATKIWFVAQDGYVYYSSDRGATVSVQDAGSATIQSLNDVSAANSLLIYAVGDNNAFIRSIDGGNIWSAVTGPATGATNDDLYKVLAIPGTDIVFVGDEEGNIYRSDDRGANWTTAFPATTATAGGIAGLVACDCNVIMFAANDQDPYFYSGSTVDGVVYQSVDGGNSWYGVEIPSNNGVNDLVCCDVNRYWVVGEGGFIANISGPTITQN